MRGTRTRLATAAVAFAVVAGGMLWALTGEATPSAQLDLAVFGAGGGVSQSGTYGVESLLGQPAAEPSEGEGVSLTPGGIVERIRLTDACPESDGPVDNQGCPAGVATTTILHVTDQRPLGTTCGQVGQRTCSFPQAGARVKVFDRNKLDGLTIMRRDGGSVTLTKNPNSQLYDDIFESETAFESAGAAEFGCVADSLGTCVAGVQKPTDLLLLARFEDASRTIYAGRSLRTSGFADTDGDGTRDRATETLEVVKVIDRNGAVSYRGGRNTSIVVV